MNCKYYSYQDYDNIIVKLVLRWNLRSVMRLICLRLDTNTKLVMEDAWRFKLLRLPINFLVKHNANYFHKTNLEEKAKILLT